MRINDVLPVPLKAARRDAIVNLKCFLGPVHQRPNVDGFIYIYYAAPPYWARISAVFSSRLAKFGRVSFAVCNVWQRSTGKQNGKFTEGGWNLRCYFIGPKFTKISDDVGDPSYFPMPLPDCPYVSFIQKIFAIKSRSRRKTEQM